jgi:hypothetical protein
MRRSEAVLIGLVLGALPPIAGFLGGWWSGAVLRLQDTSVVVVAVAGLVVGLAADVLWLKYWVRNAYTCSLWVWAGAYVFYSVCAFGFFMGVPVFNVLPGIPAGLYMGARLAHEGVTEEHSRRLIRATSTFTTLVLLVLCAASAALALSDPYTGANLRGMLGLKSEVTRGAIYAIIFGGGVPLLAVQWWLTQKVTRVTEMRLRAPA